MPAVIPFIPLITAGIGAGTTIAAARMQSGASNRATQAQSQAERESLEFLRQQFLELQRQRAPFVDFGTGALGSLADLLGLPRPQPGSGPTTFPPNTPSTPSSPPAGAGAMTTAAQRATQRMPSLPGTTQQPTSAPIPGSTGGPAGSGGPTAEAMVMMEAPDGSRQSVPSGLTDWYRARGARVVA